MVGIKQQTIAITGATGFVGSRMLNLAVREGHLMRTLTRKRQDDRPNVTWVKGALDNIASLDELCAGAEVVMHIAGVVNAPDRAGFELGNVTGTLNVVEAAKRAGARRFIHISSLAATQPQLSIYGETKARAEKIVATSGLDWTIIRPPAIYGPGDREMLDLFKMARRGFVLLPPEKNATLSLIHVDDLCRAIAAIIPEDDDLTAGIFEVDDGIAGGWTHEGFARAIGDAVQRRITPIALPKLALRAASFGDRLLRREEAKLTRDRVNYICHRDWTINSSKRLPARLWQPKVPTPKGLKDTVTWYQFNDWL